ncbi:LysR substrate-binding domain-containing protein [Caballeronia sp. ATUFL_M1_KS5A]|uniref:LysR substrate-binding domain-containing protein n=1 Tax=Caballeronia sp. ATUFL_M1_KS5A TaxID=2921778 RepID=UPI0020290C47|nr:LysR substrate-binding domain-containing protein [Caballeronia sp. ATUFL_M1_KS5A]
MNFQQLRTVREAVRRGFNLTEVSAVLHSSQPAVSRQVRDLEDELGVDLFARDGKRLVGLTDIGKTVLPLIEGILEQAESLRRLTKERQSASAGHLSIAATHAHARYLLPPVLKAFQERHPNVELHVRQGSLAQVAKMVLNGEADIGIATDSLATYAQLQTLPSYPHSNVILVLPDHPLATRTDPVTLQELTQYPIITYDEGSTGRVQLEQACKREGIEPKVVLGAVTADVIKSYVELGMGVGIATSIAWDAERDTRLRSIDAAHLFPLNTTLVSWARGRRLPGFAIDFMETFAPVLTREVIEEALG